VHLVSVNAIQKHTEAVLPRPAVRDPVEEALLNFEWLVGVSDQACQIVGSRSNVFGPDQVGIDSALLDHGLDHPHRLLARVVHQ
jgi:hypothetical protein